MATIVKHRSKWKAVVRIKGWPTKSVSFTRKSDAKEWAAKTELDMRRGVYIDSSHAERLFLSTALERYISEVSSQKAATTLDRERVRANILTQHLGGYSLAAMTPEILAKYRDARLATVSERTGRLVGANAVRLELALLSHLFNTAIREWGVALTVNPVTNISKPKVPQGRDRRLTPEEEKRLLTEADAWSNPFMGWIVRLALETAMRHGEILGLCRSQVNLKKGVVHLPQTKNGSARDVPLSEEAEQILVRAMSHPIRPFDTDLIFWGNPSKKDGKRYPYRTTKNWETIRVKAGMPDLHFHDLRHEATSRLVESGRFSDQEVATITGHKSMQMLKRYTHLRSQNLVAKIRQRG